MPSQPGRSSPAACRWSARPDGQPREDDVQLTHSGTSRPSRARARSRDRGRGRRRGWRARRRTAAARPRSIRARASIMPGPRDQPSQDRGLRRPWVRPRRGRHERSRATVTRRHRAASTAQSAALVARGRGGVEQGSGPVVCQTRQCEGRRVVGGGRGEQQRRLPHRPPHAAVRQPGSSRTLSGRPAAVAVASRWRSPRPLGRDARGGGVSDLRDLEVARTLGLLADQILLHGTGRARVRTPGLAHRRLRSAVRRGRIERGRLGHALGRCRTAGRAPLDEPRSPPGPTAPPASPLTWRDEPRSAAPRARRRHLPRSCAPSSL